MDFPDSGEAEITNFEITVCVEENIGGLQIPVNQVVTVHVLHPGANLTKNIENISVKECIALQKALDSTLFSGFEGAIRHLWSVI